MPCGGCPSSSGSILNTDLGTTRLPRAETYMSHAVSVPYWLSLVYSLRMEVVRRSPASSVRSLRLYGGPVGHVMLLWSGACCLMSDIDIE